MSQTELDRKAEIEAIELTEEEVKAAILEGKIKKWFEINSDGHYKKLEEREKTGRITFK